jgi:hypothetical protein
MCFSVLRIKSSEKVTGKVLDRHKRDEKNLQRTIKLIGFCHFDMVVEVMMLLLSFGGVV